MAKINDKNINPKWANQLRLYIVAGITITVLFNLYTYSFANVVTINEPIATVEKIVVENNEPEPVDTSPISDVSLNCLIANAYFEARNQGTAGIIGVIHVTLNRMRDKRYPDNICGVVYQAQTKPSWKDGRPIPVRNRCQFSWYCDGKPDEMNNKKMLKVVEIAVHQAIGLWYNGIDITDGATHYHATYVDPHWNNSMKLTTRLGDHKFYRIN